MKVLLVNGSSHKEGCTYTALTEVEKSLNKEGIETDIFWIGNKPISGCIACKACVKLKKCVFNNDKVNEFIEIAKDYDGFIFGTPVHWAAASGAITSFLDRVFYADSCGGRKSFYLKPAATVISARRAGTTATFDQINKDFGVVQVAIITSQYRNMVQGAKPEEVKQDLAGMQIMRTLGRNMAFFLKCKEAGIKAGVKLLEVEPTVFTNFIR